MLTAPELLDLSELVGAIGDAVIVADGANVIILWNAAAERLFGYSEQEVMGKSLDLIIPERLRKRHGEGYEHTMSTGVTKYGTTLLKVPAVTKDGASLSIAFTVAMLKDASGTPTAIAAVIRDETVRFTEDRALRKRLAEAEAELAALKL